MIFTPARPAGTARRGPVVAGAHRRLVVDSVVVVALVAATTAIGALVEPYLGRGGLDLLFLLPVMLASVRLGLKSGIATGVLASLAFNYFFLPPLYTLAITRPQSLLTLLVLTGIAAFTAEMTGRVKIWATMGVRGARENEALAAFGQALASAPDVAATRRAMCEGIARLLGVSVILLDRRGGRLERVACWPPDVASLRPVERAAADRAWSAGEATGVGTGTPASSDWQFQPLKTLSGVSAVIGLSIVEGGDPVAGRAVLLATLLGQSALVQERLRLEVEAGEVAMLRERDRLRAALLSSIGHDLRTPLTSVAVAVDSIAREYPDAAALPVARAEVARLRRFLENLVNMVRIDVGALNLSPEPIDLIDAVASAVDDLRHLTRDSHIDVQVPPSLPLVDADPILLHHVLMNLLANAAIHGGPGSIEINGTGSPDGVHLAIRDHGPGFVPGSEAGIFDACAQGRGGDHHGGCGLGLAIAKGFAEPMGVRIAAANHRGGGAVMTLSFPNRLVRVV